MSRLVVRISKLYGLPQGNKEYLISADRNQKTNNHTLFVIKKESIIEKQGLNFSFNSILQENFFPYCCTGFTPVKLSQIKDEGGHPSRNERKTTLLLTLLNLSPLSLRRNPLLTPHHTNPVIKPNSTHLVLDNHISPLSSSSCARVSSFSPSRNRHRAFQSSMITASLLLYYFVSPGLPATPLTGYRMIPCSRLMSFEQGCLPRGEISC